MIEMPIDISTEGHRIDQLIGHTTILVGTLSIGILLWIIIALVRGSRRRLAAPLPSKRRQLLVPLLFAGFILFVVDGLLFVTSSLDLHRVFLATDSAERSPDAVRIEISAQQWAWNIRYAGPDREFATVDDPVVTGVIVIPLETPVIIQLASADVVHSLHLPNVRIKRDAIPGQIATVWFEATKLGDYDLLCAQFCGPAHYRMTGTLRVVSRAEFGRFVAAASADSVAMMREDERSRVDDPERQPTRARWPTEPRRYGRDWGWAWSESQ